VWSLSKIIPPRKPQFPAEMEVDFRFIVLFNDINVIATTKYCAEKINISE